MQFEHEIQGVTRLCTIVGEGTDKSLGLPQWECFYMDGKRRVYFEVLKSQARVQS